MLGNQIYLYTTHKLCPIVGELATSSSMEGSKTQNGIERWNGMFPLICYKPHSAEQSDTFHNTF